MPPVDAAQRLLMWYGRNYDRRKLPWRVHGESVTRIALVEGLLAQTRAGAVADHYWHVFAGIEYPEDWLALSIDERLKRVSPLGLPKLKEAAVTGIALGIQHSGASRLAAELTKAKGIGPYTSSMVALLHGEDATPVDCNIERVATRFLCDDDADATAWSSAIVNAARREQSTTGHPPAYETICAVMDVGARICTPTTRDCHRCPLRHSCETFRLLGAQCILPFPDGEDFAAYKTARISETPLIEIGIKRTESSDPNMERYAEEIEGMLSVYERTEPYKIARLVIGYLASQLADERLWCRVSPPGATGVTVWR